MEADVPVAILDISVGNTTSLQADMDPLELNPAHVE
jgi:hypothetical protein